MQVISSMAQKIEYAEIPYLITGHNSNSAVKAVTVALGIENLPKASGIFGASGSEHDLREDLENSHHHTNTIDLAIKNASNPAKAGFVGFYRNLKTNILFFACADSKNKIKWHKLYQFNNFQPHI